MIAPRSSATAKVSRKIFNVAGARLPTSASTPTANAMSVAIGMPQPLTPGPPALNARYSAAGTTIPPRAATSGSAAARGSRKSPCTISRLISRPTTKKNTAISRSLTQWLRLSVSEKEPTSKPSSVCQKWS